VLSLSVGFVDKCANMYAYNDLVEMGDLNFECARNNPGFQLFDTLYAD